MQTRIFLIRHAETDMNRLHQSQKNKDPPINATGEGQCVRARELLDELLNGEAVDAVYYSPLQRTTRTMQILMANRPRPQHCESNVLIKHGSLKDDVERFVEETFVEVRQHHYRNVVVVTHGPVVRYMIQWLSSIGRLDVDRKKIHTPRNTGIALLLVNDKLELVLYDSVKP